MYGHNSITLTFVITITVSVTVVTGGLSLLLKYHLDGIPRKHSSCAELQKPTILDQHTTYHSNPLN
jgi:hypothetical protein